MKKKMIHLAGLTLAATLIALPTLAQNPPRKPEPPKRVDRVEISDDHHDALSHAQAAVTDSQRHGRSFITTSDGASGGDRPLIVSSSPLDEKALGNLGEDLNIMARVLEKSVRSGGDESERKAMGIHLWALGDSKGARNLYLDGYGALFVLNVNMPLIAPTTKAEPEEKKEPAASSAWEDAKSEIYGRNENRRVTKRFVGDKKTTVPYDAARVDALKKELTEALKNASHIRGLKDNENVTIVVQGAGVESGQRIQTITNGENEIETVDVFAFAFAGSGGGARSVMTLRAKKSDIDSFAKGKLDADDFRKKVTTATYQAPAGAAAGGGRGQMRLW